MFEQRKYEKMSKKALETHDMDEFKRLIHGIDKVYKEGKIKL